MQNGLKEIRLVNDSVPNLVHERGDTLDVWQDRATGIVLPAWLIDPYDRPRNDNGRSGGRKLALSSHYDTNLIDEFIGASDSQLIEMIIRADPNLRQREETYSELDRLADRYRVRPQTIWLPVEIAQLQGQTIPLIATERIPAWVTRIWSTALRSDSFRDSTEVVGFHTAATTNEEGLRIIHGWRARTRVEVWREAVDRFLRLMPAPISGYDLRDVREYEAALRGTFLSIGRVELLESPRKKNEVDWLQRTFDTSRNWVVLVLPWPGLVENVLELLRQRIETARAFPSSLIVVLPPTIEGDTLLDAFRVLLGPSRFPSVIWRYWPDSGPALALGDGAEARILYSPRGSVLAFSGESLAAEWLGILQALPTPRVDPASTKTKYNEPLRQLRVRRETMLNNEEPTLGLGGEPRRVAQVIDDLRGFGENLLTAVVDPQVLMRAPDVLDADTPSSTLNFDRQQPLIEQLPILSQRCDDLCYNLALAPTPPWASWTHLASHELLPSLVAMLTEPSRRSVAGEIHILTSGASNETSSVADLIEKAVLVHGWSIQIGLPNVPTQTRSEVSDSILSSIRGRIPSPRLRFWALSRPAPAHALVIDDLVFIAGGNWLGSILQPQPEATDFGFAIESREFAENLRACFVAAEEVCRYRA